MTSEISQRLTHKKKSKESKSCQASDTHYMLECAWTPSQGRRAQSQTGIKPISFQQITSKAASKVLSVALCRKSAPYTSPDVWSQYFSHNNLDFIVHSEHFVMCEPVHVSFSATHWQPAVVPFTEFWQDKSFYVKSQRMTKKGERRLCWRWQRLSLISVKSHGDELRLNSGLTSPSTTETQTSMKRCMLKRES